LDRRDGSAMEALIDTTDLDIVLGFKYKWCTSYCEHTNSYYACATIYQGIINGKPKYTSIRLSTYLINHPYIIGKTADHKNSDTLDYRRKNLRLIEDEDNSKNRKSKNSNNKSGYRNVCWCNTTQKWIVQLQINGKNKVLGRFDDVHEAGAFAELMRQKYYGEYAGRS
jgi:hypothetical protein